MTGHLFIVWAGARRRRLPILDVERAQENELGEQRWGAIEGTTETLTEQIPLIRN